MSQILAMYSPLQDRDRQNCPMGSPAGLWLSQVGKERVFLHRRDFPALPGARRGDNIQFSLGQER